MEYYQLCILGRDPYVGNTWSSVSYHEQIQIAIASAIKRTRGLSNVLQITISMDAGNEGPTHYVYIGDELGPELDPETVEYELSLAWHQLVTRLSNDWHECDA